MSNTKKNKFYIIYKLTLFLSQDVFINNTLSSEADL